jgi:crossover junction endodeoxyribonuclease RuvC
MFYLGIDPGKTGGATLLDDKGDIVVKLAFTNKTDHDISEWIQEQTKDRKVIAYIERVGSMPKQGRTSIFTFGRGYGVLIGLLTGLKVSFDLVSPGVWQRRLGCLTHGDKNVTKTRAQRMYPNETKITHATADSILIARFCYQFGLK